MQATATSVINQYPTDTSSVSQVIPETQSTSQETLGDENLVSLEDTIRSHWTDPNSLFYDQFRFRKLNPAIFNFLGAKVNVTKFYQLEKLSLPSFPTKETLSIRNRARKSLMKSCLISSTRFLVMGIWRSTRREERITPLIPTHSRCQSASLWVPQSCHTPGHTREAGRGTGLQVLLSTMFDLPL